MEIIDEEQKKVLPFLEPGDVIRAEIYRNKYYFMIASFRFKGCLRFTLVQLNHAESGIITINGDDLFEVKDFDNHCDSVDKLIENLKDSNYTDIEKVELEARVKHEN